MPNSRAVRRPKILIIGPTPPPYHGVALSTRLILDSPVLHGFQRVHLDTADRRGIENIGAFELGNIMLGLWHFVRFMGLLAWYRPQLVYLPISQGTGGYLRDLLFLLPSQALGIPTVVHLRGSEFRAFYTGAGRVMQALIRRSLGAARRVIVVGESLREVFAGLVVPDRIVAVPNGTVDFAAGGAVGHPRGDRVQGLFLSNLRRRKGVFVTLEAAIEALDRFPVLEFTFAGAWEAEADRQQAAARLRDCNVADRIHFVGTVTGDDKHRLMMESHFLVFPPIEPEGHPRVVIEAMAAGLPIITTRQGAIAETIVDGQTGFLVAPGDAPAIVEKIACLITDPQRREAMGCAARRRFLAEYTADASNTRLAGVFSDVLGAS
jgi:glycosyltransferase involved in cell wall biosynthesis